MMRVYFASLRLSIVWLVFHMLWQSLFWVLEELVQHYFPLDALSALFYSDFSNYDLANYLYSGSSRCSSEVL